MMASILSLRCSIVFVARTAGIVQPNPKKSDKKLFPVRPIFFKPRSNTYDIRESIPESWRKNKKKYKIMILGKYTNTHVIPPYTASINFHSNPTRLYIYWKKTSRYPARKFQKINVNSNIIPSNTRKRGTENLDFVIKASIFFSISEYLWIGLSIL